MRENATQLRFVYITAKHQQKVTRTSRQRSNNTDKEVSNSKDFLCRELFSFYNRMKTYVSSSNIAISVTLLIFSAPDGGVYRQRCFPLPIPRYSQLPVYLLPNTKGKVFGRWEKLIIK